MTGKHHDLFMRGCSEAEMHARRLDWSCTAIGAAPIWPRELRGAAERVFATPLPMFVAWGPDLEIIYNDGFIELLGDKHPWAMGRPYLELWQNARELHGSYVQRAQDGESLLIKDVMFEVCRGGSIQRASVTFSYAPVRGSNGAVAGIECICIENTEATCTLAFQTDQRARLEKLLLQAPGFLAVLRGPEHTFDLINDEFQQLIGSRNVVGKTVAHALPEAIDQGFIGILDRVRDTGEPFVGKEVHIALRRTMDGPTVQAYVDFVYQPLRGIMGEIDGIVAQGHEVTDQRAAREELLAFANSIPAIAWVARPDGTLERFNTQWEAYTGKSAEGALGRGWVKEVHPDDLPQAWAVWKAAKEEAEPWQTEYRLRGADGHYRWFLARAVPQRDANEHVVKWFGTTTDIEDMRRAAQTLKAADRQKDEFLATLAHELRNPLAPIRFAVDIVSSPSCSPEARAEALQVIKRQVGQMSHLLDDLIDVARITERRVALRKKPISMRDAMNAAVETVRPLINDKSHQITVEVEQPVPIVMMDPVRLAQILTNLLTNAVRYTDPGGRILMEAHSAGNMCTLRVTDDGIGLAPEATASIFEMFFQAQPVLARAEEGLGIGLALVKGLVELHGGTVSANSPGLGKGSVFEVTLPLSPTEAKEKNEIEIASVNAGRSRTRIVLLADDNADAVFVMAELIRMEGHVVHVARDGTQAMEMAAHVKPDVAILDIGMPGFDGYEVARRIRDATATANCLLIAATGWGQEADRCRALNAGFDVHFTKPLDPSAMLDIIAQGRQG